ncbi:MAG: hypothetical protein JSS82_03530 [Bacteroidetes bacterium]|nr:hypothetical protein [Bacteroidota bacterium]
MFGTLKIKWLRRRLRLIGRPLVVYVKEPKRFLAALTYMVIAVWVPMYVVYGRLQGGLVAGLFKAAVSGVQFVILNVWPIMLLAVFYFGFCWSKRRERDFTLSVFYFSSVVSLWIINMNYFYESPAKIYYSVLSLGKDSKHERVFEILRGEDVFPEYLLRVLPKTDLVFGYDCLSLTLAATTSIVFSMVYLGTAFEQRIENKKLYVTLLLLTQAGTLVAFFSLNILCFVVAFESTLVPMALLVRN